ncbi:hypothetical protein [Streptomyces sp. NPDC002785]|uniref:hypothetical protein n=1 Tax=Streptomyces sp. NPDC002785 TaxID=3154543 RepID=UPI00331D83EB
MTSIDRRTYNALYGPTTGDRIRLGDTSLWVEVEADDGTPGDELLGGCGKTVRDGLLASPRSDRESALPPWSSTGSSSPSWTRPWAPSRPSSPSPWASSPAPSVRPFSATSATATAARSP